MKILIVSATELEIRPLLRYLEAETGKKITYHSCNHHENTIDIIVTGVGLMQTAYYLGKNLVDNKYDLAFNVGIAGSFRHNIKIGDVVNIVEEQIADLGSEDETTFLHIFDMGLENKNSFPYTNGKLVNLSKTSNPIIASLPKMNGISVNKAHGCKESIDKVIQKYQPEVENMEGAAFMFACLMANISYFQIRAISNYVEPGNRSEWNIPLAIKNLNIKIIDTIKHC